MLCDAEGKEWDLTGKLAVSLCRCGASENRPFCDGCRISGSRLHVCVNATAASAGASSRGPKLKLTMTGFRSVLLRVLLPVVTVPFCGAAPLRAQDKAAQTAGASVSAAPNLAQYQGQYGSAFDPDNVTAVYLEGGVLYEESARRERQRLLPDPGVQDRFAIGTPQAHAVFVRDASDAVSRLKITLDVNGATLLDGARMSASATRLNFSRKYLRRDAMIPMRDGVRLHAVILRPAEVAAGESLPFLMYRTPYGVEEFDSERINLDRPELAASGYIFVFEDIRGRYKSEGQFVMNRPVVAHSTDKDIDETVRTRMTRSTGC